MMTLVARPLPWRLYYARNRVDDGQVLNDGSQTQAESTDLAARLLAQIKRLQAEAVDSAVRVDYAGLKVSPRFAEYCALAAGLRAFDLDSLHGESERLAFWLNLYNALILHAVIAFDVQRSITDVGGVFDRAAYTIGGLRFSANDIEHGIIRANRSHPAVPGPVFLREDPRRRWCLSRCDPRIHFALNCAARSCPPILFYRADALEQQLTLAARSFINGDGARLDRAANVLYLSRVFAWYAPDFGAGPLAWWGRAHLRRFVEVYLEEADARRWIEDHAPQVRFDAYDWTLNA